MPGLVAKKNSEIRKAGDWAMRKVAVLFARHDSVYKTLPGCEVFDKSRNAMSFRGNMPVIAHPPCRTWGKLAHFAKAPIHEPAYASWAVQQVRLYGGVLEHPLNSKLWRKSRLPDFKKINIDRWGGWTLSTVQWWFGHLSLKPTLLYIVGISPNDIPRQEYRLIDFSLRTVESLSKRQRELTPVAFAEWLVEIARRTRVE